MERLEALKFGGCPLILNGSSDTGNSIYVERQATAFLISPS
jgi:hypothetical protein